MHLFQKNLQIFLRNKHIFIVALLGLIGLSFYLSYRTYTFTMNWDVMLYLSNTQRCCLFFLVLSLYIAYEYIYCAKASGIEECAAAHKSGKFKLYGSLFCVLMLLPLLVFLIMALFNFGIAFFGGHIEDHGYYAHIFLVNFLNTFLLGTLANLLGACLALKFKRIAAYSLMALAIFIVSPVSDMIPGIATDSYGFNLWPLKRVFSKILPPNLTWVIDSQYGISNETLRWNLMLFWIFLFLAVLVLAITGKRAKKRMIAAALAVILAAVNLYGYFQGGSEITLGPYPDSISRFDKEYYREHKQKEKPAAFTVADYDIIFSIYRELEGEVKMKIEAPSPALTYDFTLYRGYVISSVTGANGDALSYTRDGDYFTVTSNTPLNEITVRYKGHSPTLFSNNQAVLLPGCFPYYPMAGFHRLSQESQGYLPITNGFRSNYTVHVNSIRDVFSNLPKSGGQKKVFSGESDILTLMGGFLAEKEIDGYDVCSLTVRGWGITNIDSIYIADLQKAIIGEEKRQESKKHLDLKHYKIFQTETTFANFAEFDLTALFDDHLFIMGGDKEWIPEIAEMLVKEYNNAEN